MEEDPFIQNFLKIRLGGRYQICKRLGSGSFGDVYIGRDVLNGHDVAIKLEHCSVDYPMLRAEVDIYEILQGRPGVPRLFWHGENCEYEAMVFELLGPNLEDLFRYCNGRFTLKTTLMLMDQLLRRVERLHVAGYLHRDIKPENILLGTGKRGNTVYLTDMGLIIGRSDSHKVMTSPKLTPPRLSLVGTSTFASRHGHLAVRASRRDDLESLGYMALYFLCGSLPWQDIRASNRADKDRLIYERKKTIPVAELCAGAPPAFATYLSYLHDLGDQDQPDYKYLRRLFAGLFHHKGFTHDNVYDWTIREFERIHANHITAV